tara:strand:+ start:890 stop:1324 length:435 start_codon:yes stop_codon:yes gene_type:complete
MTPTQRISNQINNKEALKKIIRPTGVTQEYTPVISLCNLGSELLENPVVFLNIKSKGYELVKNDDEYKLVYQKMGKVCEYQSDCFTDLHAKIHKDYKDILNVVVSQAVNNGLFTEQTGYQFKSEIANIQKPVLRKEKDKIRIKR